MCHFDFDSFFEDNSDNHQTSILFPHGPTCYPSPTTGTQAGCNEDADLPWTGAEELLVKSTVKGPTNEKIEESMKESFEIEAWEPVKQTRMRFFVGDFGWC